MRSAVLLFAMAATLPGAASAAMTWRATPEIVVETPADHGGGHRHGGPLSYWLRDGARSDVVLVTPDLEAHALTLDGARAVVKPTGMDGYHLLAARQQLPGEEWVALRYLYMPGKPSGHSPRELLAAGISRLEIVPSPLPREHWRYESSEAAVFQLRFAGAPLAQQPVRMMTSNGTLLEALSDDQGMVRFMLPEDFGEVRPGRGANAPAEMVVSAEYQADATRFVTHLNADYHANPGHWQSTLGGGLSLAAGFMAGLLVVRPRKEQKA